MKMDSKQLQQVEHNVSNALSEDGPINWDTLALAIAAFLAFDADAYIQAKGVRQDRRVVLWIHALSHFIGKLWEMRQREHLKMLYAEAHKRSSETGDYGCMDRLFNDFLKHARWFDNPRDYGFGETVPDFEKLDAEREQSEYTLESIANRGINWEYEQELIRIRLKGLKNCDEERKWKSLQRVGWQKDYD